MINLFDVLFPAFCVGCGKEGKYICDNCQVFLSENALICPVCQKANMFGGKHPQCFDKYGLDGLISIWDYEGVIKNLLHKIKYKGAFHPIKEIVRMALNITESDKTRFYDFLAFKNPGNVCLSYVPLHKKKEKTRGFNQSKLMAQEIGKITNLKTENLLEKTKETKSQTELDIKERMENVKDSFTLRLDSDFSERFTLKGSDTLRKNQNPRFANILLIDDIWTTGATMKECCKVLKKGGAKRVWGFVLARTV